MPLSKFTKQEISKLFSSAKRCLKHPSLDILLGLRSSGEGESTPSSSNSMCQQPGRILVITPGRIGNAPTRNKVRRRLKAIYYEGQFPQCGYDCVVIVKHQGTLCSFDELASLLKRAFENPPKGYSNQFRPS